MATKADLDKLNEAIYSGARRVKYRDREVEYRSIEEMKAARDLMIAELNGGSKKLSYTVPIYDKGI